MKILLKKDRHSIAQILSSAKKINEVYQRKVRVGINHNLSEEFLEILIEEISRTDLYVVLMNLNSSIASYNTKKYALDLTIDILEDGEYFDIILINGNGVIMSDYQKAQFLNFEEIEYYDSFKIKLADNQNITQKRLKELLGNQYNKCYKVNFKDLFLVFEDNTYIISRDETVIKNKNGIEKIDNFTEYKILEKNKDTKEFNVISKIKEAEKNYVSNDCSVV